MDKNSLSHTSWECACHVVWIPKYRRKVLYGEARREIGEILSTLVERMDGVGKVEGIMRDRVPYEEPPVAGDVQNSRPGPLTKL